MPEISPRVLVVIPAYNEESNIAGVVVKAQKYASWVVVCDDGSKDMTAEIADKLGAIVIRHSTRMGKGVAFKDLFRKAKEMAADVVVTIDGDGQNDPNQIPLLVKPILENSADLVNGSRFLKPNPIPNHRKAGDKILNRMTNAISHDMLTDTQSGFRAYSKMAIEQVEITEHALGVDSQLLIEAREKGLRVVEVPIDVAYHRDSSTSNPVKHGTYVALSILRMAAERSPLLYLGIPGLIAILIGAIVSINLIVLYDSSLYFSIPQAIIAVGTFVVGAILILGAVMLYAINNLVVRLRN